jgi:putative transcriptional regulator
MIKHHPKFELIQQFVKGELPASISAGISMHAEMCPECMQKITELTEQVAEISFDDSLSSQFKLSNESVQSKSLKTDEDGFDAMINSITSSNDIVVEKERTVTKIEYQDELYTLPSAISNMVRGKDSSFGKLTRTRLQLNENEIHTSLLHISPGGAVPEHTHKGFELTVLLEGSFSDEEGEYVKGDFIMLDGSHQHSPVSKNGCLCYTVANDALHFSQGINKLLKPIGTFIY